MSRERVGQPDEILTLTLVLHALLLINTATALATDHLAQLTTPQSTPSLSPQLLHQQRKITRLLSYSLTALTSANQPLRESIHRHNSIQPPTIDLVHRTFSVHPLPHSRPTNPDYNS